MLDRIDQEMAPLRTAADLRTYRQELLAANIANADTPNYKARDIDFKSALANALSGRASAGTLTRTDARHLSGAGGSAPYGTSVMYRNEYQAAVDGNTVNMDIERSAFTENAVQVEAALTFLHQRFTLMQSALQS
jgi:flagellar basal-body rod protein FlgB